MILSKDPERLNNYLSFFEFGSHVRLGARPLMIIYPPLTDAGPGHPAPKVNWERYLLPHVVYEDAKTIQDLEEVMRLLSREYKTITTDSPDIDMAEIGDRAWVCIPRNGRAKEVLKKIGNERVRFTFEQYNVTENESECILKWNKNYNLSKKSFDSSIIIKSPLSKYLHHSKRRPAGKTEWDPTHGFTYARDYAVIAKFRIKKEANSKYGEFYYNYFFGGIRGLGTWGIGHLIDHHSSSLLKMVSEQKGIESVEGDDVQILVEVTFHNYRIIEVNNVSNKPQTYFDEKYKDEFIISELLAKNLHV